jgi:Bacterial Ig-like domain
MGLAAGRRGQRRALGHHDVHRGRHRAESVVPTRHPAQRTDAHVHRRRRDRGGRRRDRDAHDHSERRGAVTAEFSAPIDGDGNFAGTAAALPEGHYIVAVTQQDDLGNQGAGDSFPFTVDTTAPAPTLTSPTSGAVVTGGQPDFRGTAGTSTGDNDAVAVELWHGTAASGEPLQILEPAVNSDGTWSGTPDTALPAGIYTARVTQYDDVGNAGVGNAVTFTVPGAATAPAPSPTAAPVVCRSRRLLHKHVDLPAGRDVKISATLDTNKARVVTRDEQATVTVDLRGKGKGEHVLRLTRGARSRSPRPRTIARSRPPRRSPRPPERPTQPAGRPAPARPAANPGSRPPTGR